MRIRLATVAISVAVIAFTLGASAFGRTASPFPFVAPDLVGLSGSWSFAVNFANSNRGSACFSGVASVAPVSSGATSFPLALTASESPGGWTVSVGDQSTVNGNASAGAGIGWTSPGAVGDMRQVNGFGAHLLAIPPSTQHPLAGKSAVLQLYAPSTLAAPRLDCPSALQLQGSPIGPAYPMIWAIGGFDGSFAGGLGCGYLALSSSGSVPNDSFYWPSTTFTGRFILTDAFAPETSVFVRDPSTLCADGKATRPYIPSKPGTVPKLIGLTLPGAQGLLARVGYRAGKVTYVHSSTVNRAIIFKQTPLAGKKLNKGQTVALVVSLGPP